MPLPVHLVLLAAPVSNLARRRCPRTTLRLSWLLPGTARICGAIGPYPHASCTRAPSPSSATFFAVLRWEVVGPSTRRRSRLWLLRGAARAVLARRPSHPRQSHSQNFLYHEATGSSSAPYVVEWPPRSALHCVISLYVYLSFYVYRARKLGPGSCGVAAVLFARIKV